LNGDHTSRWEDEREGGGKKGDRSSSSSLSYIEKKKTTDGGEKGKREIYEAAVCSKGGKDDEFQLLFGNRATRLTSYKDPMTLN